MEKAILWNLRGSDKNVKCFTNRVDCDIMVNIKGAMAIGTKSIAKRNGYHDEK